MKFSPIFKTKNNELAIFGNTLDDIRQKLIRFNEVKMQGGVWGSNKSQIIPEENLIKELSFDEAKLQLDDFNKCVIVGGQKLEDYFTDTKAGNSVLRTYVTTTDQQSQSVQGLMKASQEARATQIAHNAALEQQTLSAKASQVALKGLAMAGNMLTGMLIGMAVSAFVGWLDDMAHAAERAKETAEEFSSSFEDMQKTHRDNTSTIAELSDEYKKLSQGVNALGDNVSLGTDEYNRYHEITNIVADLMPDLVQGWDAEGNAILKVKGHLADLNEEYRKTKQNEARKT